MSRTDPGRADAFSGPARGTRAAVALVDGHVHFYGCFDVDRFFDAAAENLAAGAAELRLSPPYRCALMLTETSRDHFFRRFGDLAGKPGRRWSFRRTDEPTSLEAERADGVRLTLVAGRQVAARGGLEVLALNTACEFQDGLPFDSTLDAVLAEDAVAVVPWGFGKWRHRRREAVERALERCGSRLLLGDNAGRLAGSRRPPLLDRGGSRGIWTLPGSDPLPFPSEAGKVGRFGCRLPVAWDARRPAASVCRALRELAAQPPSFGRLERFGRFCRLQLAMQLRKHGRRWFG